MLEILSVNLTGFCAYGPCADVQLSGQGLVHLQGLNKDKDNSSNGAGKTSIFNAIAFCLFGRIESFTSETVAVKGAEVVNEIWARGCCPRVVFRNSRGEVWRVTVTRAWKGEPPYPNDSGCYPFEGSDIYLEQYENEVWHDRRAAEMPNTRKRVLAAVGISYERYLATTYLAQGRGFDFLKGTHAQRMAILTDVLRLHVWDASQADAKQEAHTWGKQVHAHQLKLASVSGQISALVVLSEAEEAAMQAEGEEAEKLAREALKAREYHQGLLATMRATLAQLRAGEDPYQAKLALVRQQIKGEREGHLALLASLTSQGLVLSQAFQNSVAEIAANKDQRQIELERALLEAEVVVKQRLDLLQRFNRGDMVSCPLCGADPPEEKHLEREYEQADAARDRIVQAIENLDDLLIRDRSARLINLAEDLSEKQVVLQNRRAREISRHEQEAADLAAEEKAILDDIERLKAGGTAEQIATLEQQITASDQAWAHAGNEATRLATVAGQRYAQVERNRGLRQQQELYMLEAEQIRTSLAAAQQEQSEWECVAKNVGDKGFKSWKIASATERLNTLLQEVLIDLDGSFQVYCQPFRPTAAGAKKDPAKLTADDLVPEFTLYVREGQKKAVPLALYSGGESTLVAFALLVAFWRLSDEGGRGTNLLLLDEAVGALDGRNAQIVIRFIEGLKSSGRTVIVVSHSTFVDSVDFDRVLQVTKEGGISRIDWVK